MPKERVSVNIFADSQEASRAVARRIAEIVRTKAAADENAVLGLATGHTPVKVYRELIRLHQQEGLDFSRVITFNLDEYWPIDPAVRQSYHHWMHENLFKHINVPPESVHIPSATVEEKEIDAHCRQYEEEIAKAGGIDFQILGIGRTGHIGFNEPGTSKTSRTCRVHLDSLTRKDAGSDFFGEENVPKMAITMGVGTILEAREIALLAFGEQKAPIIRRTAEEEVSALVAASFLQEHPQTRFYLDEASAADLTRLATPWLLGSCQWDEELIRQALVWLSLKLKKPILKLTHEDYLENGLEELPHCCGATADLNVRVFRELMETITGWPGGKEGGRRILLLSPHPDDDVISMGGTFIRCVEQGHDMHVAYMVTGHLSVFDHNVSRYMDFMAEFSRIFGMMPVKGEALEEKIDAFLQKKRPGDMDTQEVQAIKGLIRRTEAIDAAKYCGLDDDHIHFLDMPFYETGKVQKLSISDADVAIVLSRLEQTHPEIIFAAGDMSDPHGTHRLCLEALLRAMEVYLAKGHEAPQIWLYRGAWQEWAPEQIDMAVPVSPDELKRKRYAIFRHESQKDRAMFPGPYDTREFWQRAEERNQNTAELYDALGLPEYHGIEAFARYPLRGSAHAQSQLEPMLPCRKVKVGPCPTRAAKTPEDVLW